MKLKRLLRRTLIVVSALLAMVLATSFGLGLWIYLYPQAAWRFAQLQLLPSDLKVEWQDLRITFDHAEGLSWNINLFIHNLTVEKQSPQIAAKIDQIQLMAKATLFSPETKLHIQNLSIKSDSPLTMAKESTLPAKEKPLDLRAPLEEITSQIVRFKSYQRRIAIDKLDVQLSDLRYLSDASKPVRASVQLSKTDIKATQMGFNLKARDLSSAVSTLDFGGAVELANFDTNSPFLIANVDIKGSMVEAAIPIALVYENGELKGDSQLKISYRLSTGRLVATPTLDFRVNQSGVFVHATGGISGMPGPIPKLQNIDVSYNLPLNNEVHWLSSKGQVVLTAPLSLLFIDSKTRKLIELKCRCKLIQSISARVEADIWLGRLLRATNGLEPAVAAELRLQTISNAILTAKLGGTLEIVRAQNIWLFKPALDSQVQVERFQDVLAILRASRILVPAPFSVLEGRVEFSTKNPILIHEATGQISAQATLSTDLRSLRQKVNVETVLDLRATSDFKSIKIEIDATIHDLWLELPPLEPVNGLPRLIRDSRIQLKPAPVRKKPAVSVSFDFKFRTSKKGAIRLLHPFAHPYIPVSVNFERADQEKSGSIQIEDFKIKYFKREVFVESVKLSLNETADADFPIDGLFHVNQTNYKVMIHVAGTVKSPTIDLSSEPYLDRADIVSVLLFDRTRENLVGGDSETSGNAQAALADRAVGLFGLWAFAATPIRSVSYNSVTKTYAATVALGEGLTAAVGTTQDDYTSLEIRKRLSKQWVVTTSWAPSDAGNKSSEVVLQWEKRY